MLTIAPFRSLLLLALGVPALAQEPSPATLPRTAAPAGAQVYFLAPANGATVTSPVTIRFGLRGMGVAPVRATAVESALVGNRPDDTLLRDVCETCRKFEATEDIHASAAYRQQLATVMSRRALERARARLPSQRAN